MNKANPCPGGNGHLSGRDRALSKGISPTEVRQRGAGVPSGSSALGPCLSLSFYIYKMGIKVGLLH